jgi:hypothetical protein
LSVRSARDKKDVLCPIWMHLDHLYVAGKPK